MAMLLQSQLRAPRLSHQARARRPLLITSSHAVWRAAPPSVSNDESPAAAPRAAPRREPAPASRRDFEAKYSQHLASARHWLRHGDIALPAPSAESAEELLKLFTEVFCRAQQWLRLSPNLVFLLVYELLKGFAALGGFGELLLTGSEDLDGVRSPQASVAVPGGQQGPEAPSPRDDSTSSSLSTTQQLQQQHPQQQPGFLLLRTLPQLRDEAMGAASAADAIASSACVPVLVVEMYEGDGDSQPEGPSGLGLPSSSSSSSGMGATGMGGAAPHGVAQASGGGGGASNVSAAQYRLLSRMMEAALHARGSAAALAASGVNSAAGAPPQPVAVWGVLSNLRRWRFYCLREVPPPAPYGGSVAGGTAFRAGAAAGGSAYGAAAYGASLNGSSSSSTAAAASVPQFEVLGSRLLRVTDDRLDSWPGLVPALAALYSVLCTPDGLKISSTYGSTASMAVPSLADTELAHDPHRDRLMRYHLVTHGMTTRPVLYGAAGEWVKLRLTEYLRARWEQKRVRAATAMLAAEARAAAAAAAAEAAAAERAAAEAAAAEAAAAERAAAEAAAAAEADAAAAKAAASGGGSACAPQQQPPAEAGAGAAAAVAAAAPEESPALGHLSSGEWDERAGEAGPAESGADTDEEDSQAAARSALECATEAADMDDGRVLAGVLATARQRSEQQLLLQTQGEAAAVAPCSVPEAQGADAQTGGGRAGSGDLVSSEALQAASCAAVPYLHLC